MEIWCNLTGKTPDELANEDTDRMRSIIAEGLRDKFVKQGRSVVIRAVVVWINALNRFWKYDGRQVKGRKYNGMRERFEKRD